MITISSKPGDLDHPAEVAVPSNQCPYCGAANPSMSRVWTDHFVRETSLGWAAYRCNNTRCRDVILLRLRRTHLGTFEVLSQSPDSRVAKQEIPPRARHFLQQAFDTLHAPDAAAVMAASAVDAMLKAKGYKKGNLYPRINQALKDHVLTQGMADWAHAVRMEANNPRHADEDRPHITADEAKQSVEFAEALGEFLFVLTAKIDAGVAEAEGATEKGDDNAG